MEGISNWNLNEQSIVNNANDWRSQHEPNLRFNGVSYTVRKLKILFPKSSVVQIEDTAFKIEEKIYGIAKDKDDYRLKIMRKMFMMESQQWLPQYIPISLTISQVHMQGRQEFLSQQQMQGTQPWNTPNMQQQAQPSQHQQYGLLKQSIQQQFPHPTSFPSIQQPSASFSSMTSSPVTEDQVKLVTEVMDVMYTQQNHSTSQQSDTASFRGMAQQNMHGDNAPAFPSEQQQNIHFGESGNFDVYGSSLLGTQGQELGQSQPTMYQSPQNGSLQQHLDESQRFQAASGEEWQEETYQKIQALKKMCLPFLSPILQKYVEKFRKIDSLPRQKQKGIHKEIESLRMAKSFLEQVIELLNVPRNRVSEKHRDNLALWEEKLRSWMRSKTEPPNRMQKRQRKFPPPHSLQKRRKMKSKDENNIMASSGNVVLPSIRQNPQVVQSDTSLVKSAAMFQQKNFHHRAMQQGQSQRQQLQQPEGNQQLLMPTSHETNELDDVRMRQGINIEAGLLQQHLSSSQLQLPTPLASPAQLFDQQILGGLSFVTPSPVTSFDSHFHQFQTAAQSPPCQPTQQYPAFALPPDQFAESYSGRMIRALESSSQETREMRSVMSLAERIPGSFQSRPCLAKDLNYTRRRSLTTHEEPNQSKRTKRLITSRTDDGYKHFSGLESEGNSTASSGSKVNKTNTENM